MADSHKYFDAAGNHIVGGPAVGWINSDAVIESACSKCGSNPGYHCETPAGKKAWPPHRERRSANRAKGVRP